MITKILYCIVRWLGLMKYFSLKFNCKLDIWYEVYFGYKTESGASIKCHKCKCKNFKINIVDKSEYGILEYNEECKKCGITNAYWAYGSYQL